MNSIAGFSCFFLWSCTGKNKPEQDAIPSKPEGFPVIHYPKDNLPSQARIALGKKIFFDPRFSSDHKISCASCHLPGHAFADTLALSKGAHGGTPMRNTPTLINVAWHPYFDYDGGVIDLERQVFVPFDGKDEMNSNLLTGSALMQKDSAYVQLARKAYGRNPDPWVITRALAAYQRSLTSSSSRYDKWKKAGKGFTEEEITGYRLFTGTKTNCTKCHSGIFFTDYSFQNIGIENTTGDTGRMRVTLDPDDYGKFKTPGLRNVARTWPYMHDGSLRTLEEVIDFYDRGGDAVRNKSKWVKPLKLTPAEKKALVAFLKTLNDE